MSTSTTTTPDMQPGVAAAQIAFKAGAELASLEARLAAMQEQGQQLHTEREQLILDRDKRQDHLTDIRKGLADLHTRHLEATTYASIATGTLGEQEALRRVTAMRPHIADAASHVESIEKSYADLEEKGAARLIAIDLDLQHISLEYQDATMRIQEVVTAQAQALSELGSATHARLLASLKQQEEELAALKRKQTTLLIARQHFLEEAAQELKDWPSLAAQFVPPFADDDNTRMISAFIEFLREALKNKGHTLGNLYNLPSIRQSGQPWGVLFALSPEDFNEIHPQGKRPLPGRGLAGKVRFAEIVLEEYRRTIKK